MIVEQWKINKKAKIMKVGNKMYWNVLEVYCDS